MNRNPKWGMHLGEAIRQKAASGEYENLNCTHLDQVRDVLPSAEGCEDCLKTGDRWVHLRMCLTCGYVGCCDNSRNKHATKHFRASGHPLIVSMEPADEWAWCFEDQLLLPMR